MPDCPQHARTVKTVRCQPSNGPATANSGPGGIHWGSYNHYIQSALLDPSDPLYDTHENLSFCVTIDGQTPNQSHVGRWSERADNWIDLPSTFPNPGWNFQPNAPLGSRFLITEILPWSATSCNLPGTWCDDWGTPNSAPAPDNIILLPTIVDSCNNQAWDCDNGDCVFNRNWSGTYSGDLYHAQNYNPYFSQFAVNPNVFNSLGCQLSSGCSSWDCRTDKFGNSGCVNSLDGTGIYNSLQDCQDNCFDQVRVDLNTRVETVIPWVDEEFGGCKSDIYTCPCGWDYHENYQSGLPAGAFDQYNGLRMCTSPNYPALHVQMMNTQVPPTSGIFVATHWVIRATVAYRVPCVELQGLYHPTVGMSFKAHPQAPILPIGTPGSQPYTGIAGPLFAPQNYSYNVGNTTYTESWDKYVIAAVDPAFSTSLIAYTPLIQPASPCPSSAFFGSATSSSLSRLSTSNGIDPDWRTGTGSDVDSDSGDTTRSSEGRSSEGGY